MSTSLERLQYGFDRDSRRTWRRRVLATGEDYAYGYDGLSQVVSAARGNLNLNASAIAAVPVAAESWDYDPTGNWQGYQTQAGGTVMVDQQRVHDQGNRLTQVSGNEFPIVLDRVGRMLEVPPDASGDWSDSMSITWDAWSRIVEITYPAPGSVLGNYAYDGLSRRITRTVAGTLTHTYYSDAWRPLEDRASDNTTVENQYLWGARHRDDLVRADLGTGSGGGFAKSRYVLMDYFSPAAITDVTGAVMERYAFSAFGVRRILAPDFSARSISECGFEFAFQGQFQDTETSLLNYGYRYYSPFLGRWLSKDPIGFYDHSNIYLMTQNNPSNKVDLLGLLTDGPPDCCKPCKAAEDAGLDKTGEGRATGGAVICCAGKKYPCSFNHSDGSAAGNCIDKCTEAHEQRHIDNDTPSCAGKGQTVVEIVNFKPGVDSPNAEFFAVGTETGCLKDCMRHNPCFSEQGCPQKVQARITKIANYKGTPTTPFHPGATGITGTPIGNH